MTIPRLIVISALLWAPIAAGASMENLVSNGSFEQRDKGAGAPVDWTASGASSVDQRLTSDRGRAGGSCARLACTRFDGEGPDNQAMLCQVGKVRVRRGQWYRLTFYAKAEGIRPGAVDIALTDMRAWRSAGLTETCRPASDWARFEFQFQAKNDLPAESSRLQFWFKSTGTLWLDDVELTESANATQWLPELQTQGVKNFVPNSSFECGAAGWGSYTWGARGWAGNLFRLEGEIDREVSQHGGRSLRISLSPETRLVLYSDYYDAVREPIRRVLAANRGWFRVTPGVPLTLSAWLRADAEETQGQLVVIEAPDRRSEKTVVVGTGWHRYGFTFTPWTSHLFIAVGLDLTGSARDRAALWIDSVQLEPGAQPTAYEPRKPVESFIETGMEGNLFTRPVDGASITLRAFNNGDRPQTVRGALEATDFFEQSVFRKDVSLRAEPHAAVESAIPNITRGRRGFFRFRWRTPTAEQVLRCATFDPLPEDATDSVFGFNHAYPQDFLMRLARQAGVFWWRDWSAKWAAVEPSRGRFDFQVADEQIDRVKALGGNTLVLLPFPSASWNTTARAADVTKAAENSAYLQKRLPFAFAPKNPEDFGRYAVETLRHFSGRLPGGGTTIQILNEPVYTDYALPGKFGYSIDDYLQLLKIGGSALKAADPNCRVVGGMGANLTAPLTREFIEKGGFRWIDVLDLHVYDPPQAAEDYDESFSALEDLMRSNGGAKPVWITEYGCYADDDPATLPASAGDAAMNRSRWPSERAAAEHAIKFAAIGMAHGLQKIFFHAGSSGTINGNDAGGVLFEYGGAPRKILPALAVFTRLVGAPESIARFVRSDGVVSPVFKSGPHFVGVAWSQSNGSRSLHPSRDGRVYDMMGNEITADAEFGASPVYIVSESLDAVLSVLRDSPHRND